MLMRIVLIVCAVALLIPAASAQSQQPATDLGGNSGSLNPPASKAPVTTDDIFNSQRWRQLVSQYREWLSVQNLYTDQQIAQLDADLRRYAAKMTPQQLLDFMHDSEQRMAVLLSDEAMNARAFLSNLTPKGKQLALGSDSGQMPNVFAMSATQLREQMQQFKNRRNARNQAQEQFNRVQGEKSRMVAQAQQERRAAQAQAAANARSSSGYWQAVDPNYSRRQTGYSPYAPRRPLVTSGDAARWEIFGGFRGW